MAAGPARAGRSGRAAGRFGWGDLVGRLRRRPGTIAVVFLAIAALVLLYAATRVPLYRAEADVVPGGGSGEAASRLIRSRDMARNVAAGLHGAKGAPIGIGVDRLVEGVTAERPAGTLSLRIGFIARQPDDAAAIANEYARQFVRQRPDAGAAGASRILAEAVPPATPITAGPLPIVAAGLIVALLAAVAAALLRERAYGGITTGDEIERRTGLHNLGVVPLLASILPEATSPADAIVSAPRSGFAEALRSLRTAARIAAGEGAQVITITAVSPEAGASTLAACLARTIALAGESVVLVTPGSAAAGSDAAPTRDASGSEILSGVAVDEALTTTLRARFAWIVIDAPDASGAQSEAALRVADIVLVAIRWRSTPAKAVRRLAERLSGEGRPGFAVLTQVDMRRQVKYVHGDVANYYGRLSKYYS